MTIAMILQPGERRFMGTQMTANPNPTPDADVVAISSPVELLVQLLKQASLISRPMIEGVAAPNGLSANELRIIMCLGGEGALAGHEISATMAIPPMNVSRAIATLIERGWVESMSDPANRRRKPVQLSAAGWERYRALIPDVAAVATDLLGGLTATERTTLARISAKTIARIESWQP
jgi:DNA-binding MarR family transcriptional regulator